MNPLLNQVVPCVAFVSSWVPEHNEPSSPRPADWLPDFSIQLSKGRTDLTFPQGSNWQMNSVLFSLRPKAILPLVHQTSIEPHVPMLHTSYFAVSLRHQACAKAGNTLCLLWHTFWSREGDVALDLKWQFLGIICH